MTHAEEDALVNDLLEQWSSGRTALIALFRLAIRAAVAQERERCGKIVGTYQVPVGNSPAGEMACEWTMDALREIAAAIRRGEA